MNSNKTRDGNVVAARPNWTSPVTEVYEFRTYVSTSRDGSEQREALRQTPRIEVGFNSDQFGDVGQRVHADLATNHQGGRVVAACRWRTVGLSADHAAGSTTLAFSGATPWWLVAGARLVLESATALEEATVESVVPGSITLTAPTAHALEAGDRAHLAYDARYKAQTALRSLVANHRGGAINLEVDPGTVPAEASPPEPVYGRYKGYPVFLASPDWAQAVSVEINDLREMADFGSGVIDAYEHPADRTVKQTLSFVEMSQESADALLGFFMARKGQRDLFWLPSQLSDLRAAFSAAQGSSTLTVGGSDARAYASSRVYTAIMARWPDGKVQVNQITGYAAAGSDTALSMYDPWARDVQSGATLQFATLSRFATDRIELRWLTNGVAQTNLPILGVTSDWIDSDADARDDLVFVPGGHISAPYDDPVNFPFQEFDLWKMGVSQDAVDAGLVTVDGEFSAVLDDAGGTVSAVVILNVRFFADDETQLLSPDDQQVNSVWTREPGSEAEVHTLTLPPARVPAGARYARFRANLAGPHHNLVQGCRLVGPQWGTDTTEGDVL